MFGQNVIVEGNDITEQFATEIQEQDQTLWEKIKEWFANVIAQFKDVDDIQQDLKRIAKKLQKMQSNLAKQKTSTEKGEVMHSKNVDLSNVEEAEYRYLYKKPIKTSKEEWSAVNSQRTKKYGDLAANKIPNVDFFIVGTYNDVSKGFKYFVVNYDKNNFSIVAKKKLKDYGVVNNNDTRRKANLETTRDGVQEGLYIDNNRSNRDGRRGGKDANLYEEQPKNDRPTIDNGGGSDGRIFVTDKDERKSLTVDSEGNTLTEAAARAGQVVQSKILSRDLISAFLYFATT